MEGGKMLQCATELRDFGFNIIALMEREKKPHFGAYRGGEKIGRASCRERV